MLPNLPVGLGQLIILCIYALQICRNVQWPVCILNVTNPILINWWVLHLKYRCTMFTIYSISTNYLLSIIFLASCSEPGVEESCSWWTRQTKWNQGKYLMFVTCRPNHAVTDIPVPYCPTVTKGPKWHFWVNWVTYWDEFSTSCAIY